MTARTKAAFSRRKETPEARRLLADPPYWWAYDPEAKTFRHRTTGEEVRYVDAQVERGARGERTWHRLDYVHEADGAWYPLLLETKIAEPEPASGIAQWIDWQKAGAVEYEDRHAFSKFAFRFWRVDHDRSLAAWRAAVGDAERLPPYGLWRRADIAIIAAGLCIPSPHMLGSSPDMIALNGGWLNGAWRSDYYRRSTYSWHRASGADKSATTIDGSLKAGHGREMYYPIEDAWPMPLNARCPHWEPGEIQVVWREPRLQDQVREVACMREVRTGELLYATSWHHHDPITSKDAWALDMHYAGYGFVIKDVCDFRYRPAEAVLADPINVAQDFAPCDFIYANVTPSRPRFVEVYDLDLAKTVMPAIKVAPNMLHAGVATDPEDIVEWRALRHSPFGDYRLGLTLHEALLHALPFSPGFDLAAPTRKGQVLGDRAILEMRSGETGCRWLYETTVRMAPHLASDGEQAGWRKIFE